MRYSRAPLLAVPLLAMTACSMGLRHAEVVGGSTLSYVRKGDAGPTVVFEAGIGDNLSSWAPVFDDVAAFARAFAYSRSGYAGGAPWALGHPSRTADDIARDAHELFRKTGLGRPMILVGHSMGGMYVLRYAELYPEDVAGVVLFDGRLKGFTEECEEAGLSPCSPPIAAQLLSPSHIAAEIRGIGESEAQMADPEQYGPIPMVVVAATEPPPGAPAGAQRIWLRVQEAFASSLANGRYVVAEGAGHYIHRDDPELAVQVIRDMVAGGCGGRC